MTVQKTSQSSTNRSPQTNTDNSFISMGLIFESLPLGVALIDRQYRIQRYNPIWGSFALRYAPENGKPLSPGVGYFEHLPGSESIVEPLFQRTLNGETIRENNIRLESGGIESYWDVVLVPLIENNEVIGIMNVAVDVTEKVLLQNKLGQSVEERTRELQMLLDVSATANSSLNLDETLEQTLDLIVALVGASRVGVVLLDEQTDEFIPYILRPAQNIEPNELSKILEPCRAVSDSGAFMYIEPNAEQGLLEPGALLPLHIRSKGLGVLAIIGARGSVFSEAQLALFQSIADQLSVAIENAHLFKKNEQAAITAERNRLARDLHDAVTQTLFSSSMIADVLPRIWERNPDEGRRRLDELRQLTRGALSEMRTLLVELRPAALVDTDLGDLIGHQVNAFIARTRITVTYDRNCTNNPPVEVKEAFYRIAQEAFNNIAKHSEASQVSVILDCQPDHAELSIRDDGVGFDSQQSHHEGLGMGIMYERARAIGAQIDLYSKLQDGVRLRIVWQAVSTGEING